MKKKIVVERYAEAYVAYAKPILGMPSIVEEFKNFRKVVRDNPKLISLLSNPGIPEHNKFSSLSSVLGKFFSEEFITFLKLLIEKQRFSEIIDITDYIRVRYAHGDVLDAVVKTANLLDTNTLKALKEKLEAIFKKNMNIYLEIDPSILGGVHVTVGNTIIDGSLRRRLSDLKEDLVTVRI